MQQRYPCFRRLDCDSAIAKQAVAGLKDYEPEQDPQPDMFICRAPVTVVCNGSFPALAKFYRSGMNKHPQQTSVT
ncbi:hypothetical protein [Thetidibacter halocola]|uniref:Uncharacterized protein n=1 Tax=Thetidibacter halocola TaxID=2827239 RepID=A0A8J7WF96_9RHOB|nr:hypothetical protein [Thetidibacter halocola]MBS0126545.1 hypothetical protein [Thetidibacter halocola]